MIVYKLTNKDRTTRNGTLWEIGVMNRTDGEGGLCGSGWLHCYEHPLLAVLHDPIHGAFGASARMFRCEAGGQILKDGQMKMGCTELTPIEEIPLPSVTTIQRIAYAIYCAQCVYHDQWWNAWADKWLSGEDRTEEAAAAAARAAARAAAKRVAGRAAKRVAAKRVAAADVAEWSARAAGMASAKRVAWRSADVAAAAARAAAAEWSARAAAKETNLIACAEKGVKIEK